MEAKRNRKIYLDTLEIFSKKLRREDLLQGTAECSAIYKRGQAGGDDRTPVPILAWEG
jgi:hypothetical protein